MFPYLFPLASPSLPPSLSHTSRWSQSTDQLSILRLVVYICPSVHVFIHAFQFSPSLEKHL